MTALTTAPIAPAMRPDFSEVRTADGDAVLGFGVGILVIVGCPFPCGRDRPDRCVCGSPSPGTTGPNWTVVSGSALASALIRR
ncbi:hypothetical protein GCM10023083_44290 [Streptomyces phyllanthi]